MNKTAPDNRTVSEITALLNYGTWRFQKNWKPLEIVDAKDCHFTDASGKLNTREQITATMRGESENTNVADHVAKSLAKRYAAVLKNDKTNSAKNTVNPSS